MAARQSKGYDIVTAVINLNADMGEGFGAYRIGNDDAILKTVASVSIACGFHAGDPVTMHEVVVRAREEGVSIGAHPGFNDIWGFGRRRIDMRPEDLEYMVAYQIGALQAMAAYAGTKVTHLKPHGALNNIAAERHDYALAVGRAIKAVDPSIIYVALSGSEMEKAGRSLGLPVAREGFCDRRYDDEGNLWSRKHPDAMITDPEVAAKQVVRMVLDGEVVSRNGKAVKHPVDTLCIHGDEDTAIPVAKACRKALEDAGVKILTLPEMKLS
jgi:5-oxoprolinase (ATP-hydrolysing) subunit A